MNGPTEGSTAEANGLWTLPGYTHERELGSGASGHVVLARHEATGTRVAIKYLSSAVGDTTAFRAEAVLLGDLRSPQVAALYEYVEGPQGAAIVMELVDGIALRALLREEGATSPEAALVVLKGSLLGLAAAHAAGVVHRDYKPENVLIAADGSSKLVDFGIAVRSGETPGIAGTPVYMAPEQWAGEPASPSADVYAATATFFECLTGAKPYSGTTIAELAVQHTEAPIPDELAPEPVRPLIRAGLAKTPQERPKNATALVAKLEQVARAGYGEEWEERGRDALAALVALLPLLLLPSGGAAGAGTTALATTVLDGTTVIGGAVSADGPAADAAPSTAPGPHPARRPRVSRRARLAAGAVGVALLAGTMAKMAVADSADASGVTSVAAPAPELTTSLAPAGDASSAGPSPTVAASASASASASAAASTSPSPSASPTPGGTAAPTPGSPTPKPGATGPKPTSAGPTPSVTVAPAPTTPPVVVPTTPAPASTTPSPSPSPAPVLRVFTLGITGYGCYGNYGTQGTVNVTTDGAAAGTLTVSWIDGGTTRTVVATQTFTLAKGQTKASIPVNHTFADNATAWGLQVDTNPAALRGQDSYQEQYAFQCNPPR
ncbi:serine/threonine-protein kinase [Kitasatospora azatica]|uniref:serine/threonine-protein kinase n=1 Tax=Kitasatospora azatica TaxID=58347 RepID=UPI000690F7CB|nr:serine/threonine-protein kinase [Kitasatospora azatica]